MKVLSIIISCCCSQKCYKNRTLNHSKNPSIQQESVLSQLIAHEGMGIFRKLLTIIPRKESPFPSVLWIKDCVPHCLQINSFTSSYCVQVQCQTGYLASLSVLKKETVLSALQGSSSNFIDKTITEFCCLPLMKTS